VSEPKSQDKPFDISKWVVWEAYQRVKANKGAAGVDDESIAEFEQERDRNLYRIWNRMSSGSYFPPPVKAVEIPKAGGKGVRVLGVPTVADRVAQTAVRMYLEPKVEPVFHPDSYGYRPKKSALDAVGTCRQRCWRADWVIDLDIKAFFDSVPWDLILKAVEHHLGTDQRWILLYVRRWLAAPIQQPDGSLVERDRGTPQGSAISPLLANVFMHYAFDAWMVREFPSIPSNGIVMTWWCTVGARGKPAWCGMPSRHGWRRSVWSCIQTRRASSTARTPTGVTLMRSRRSRSWGIRFGPGWPRTSGGSTS
jgi:RNA-directed DNA polymerase